MDKKIIILCLLVFVGLLLAACIPELEPHEVLPYCREAYKVALVDNPGLPRSFIGYCVATIQTGDEKAAQALCSYEPLWGDIGATSISECVQIVLGL